MLRGCSRANNRLRYGVETTETCYDNFTAILKQFEQAEADVKRSSASLSGKVSVGLAPYSAGGTLSLANDNAGGAVAVFSLPAQEMLIAAQ